MKLLPDASAQTCVASPPYFGLRDYGVDGQIGLEPTPDEYVARMVEVFREVRRVLRDDGTLRLNLGDSYAHPTKGTGGGWAADPNNYTHKARAFGARKFSMGDAKPKDLIGIPWRLAFALQADGWYLRSDIVWNKPNAMPESVKDRPTRSHEFLFMLTKSEKYYYDWQAVREPADGGGLRNRRSVWTVATKPFKGPHFAAFPPALIEPCILAGSRLGDTVLDPFGGAGTTGLVAQQHGRNAVLTEINPEYAEIARRRIGNDAFVL